MVKTKVVTSRPRDPPAGVVLPARGSKQNFASSTLPLYVEREQTARDIRSMTVCPENRSSFILELPALV